MTPQEIVGSKQAMQAAIGSMMFSGGGSSTVKGGGSKARPELPRTTGNRVAANIDSLTTAEQMALLREAANGGSLGKGNFSLGQASATEANKPCIAWVGPGYRISSDGSSWVSGDGLRIYRLPSAKLNSTYAETGVQANFESKLTPGSRPTSNGHLNITP